MFKKSQSLYGGQVTPWLVVAPHSHPETNREFNNIAHNFVELCKSMHVTQDHLVANEFELDKARNHPTPSLEDFYEPNELNNSSLIEPSTSNDVEPQSPSQNLMDGFEFDGPSPM